MEVTFGHTKTLYSGPTSPLVARIAALGDKVYVVCNEAGSTSIKNRQAADSLQEQIDARSTIRCGISTDSGENFGELAVLYQSNVAHYISPEIVAANGSCYLIWGDSDTTATEPVVLFSKSKTDQSGFEIPIRLNLPSAAGTQNRPKPEGYQGPDWDAKRRELFRRWYLVPRVKLAASGRNVYVFWAETTARLDSDAEYKLYFLASNDGGITFGEKKHVGTTIVRSGQFMRMFHINLTASGDEVYMMWVQFTPVPGYMFSGNINPLEAHIVSSRDAGRTIERIVDLSSETTVVRGDTPSVDARENASELRKRPVAERLPLDISATGNGGVGMVLIGHETYDPMNFANDLMRRTSMSTGNRIMQSTDLFDINLPVFFAKSSDHCASFSDPVLLADHSAGIDDTYLICDQENTYVLWQAILKNGAMNWSSSVDGGRTFSKTKEIEGVHLFHPMGHPVYNGSMVLTHDRDLLVAIRNDVKSPTGEPQDAGSEVIFSMINQSGPVIESRKLNAEGTQVAIFPSVAAVDSHVYVAWSETSKDQAASIKFCKGLISR